MERFGGVRAGSVVVALGMLLGVVACGTDGTANGTAVPGSTTVAGMTSSDALNDGSIADSTNPPSVSTSQDAIPTDAIVWFPDASSVAAWRNVDDSVMGGVSASRSTWVASEGRGAMEFTGDLSTENNGGFASTLSRVDTGLGMRAAGARALGLRAFGDGRTYLLQLRAGPSGADRWISRFTPPSRDTGGSSVNVELPLASFEPVNQFLRPVDPQAALDPASISQIGIYVLDGQVGSFRLIFESISALR
jgi:hypothetical protein